MSTTNSTKTKQKTGGADLGGNLGQLFLSHNARMKTHFRDGKN
jgi:hypothetical protein